MNLNALLNPGGTAIASPLPSTLPPSPPLVPAPRFAPPTVRSWGAPRHLHSMTTSTASKDVQNEPAVTGSRVSSKGQLELAVLASPRKGSLPPRIPPPPPPGSETHKVYHTTLLYNSLTKTLQAIRKEAGKDDQLQRDSLFKIGSAFNTDPEIAHLRSALWSEWNDYARFCAVLDIPPFPITPVKAALCITRYVDLPISSRLRAMTDTKNGPSSKRVEVAFTTLRRAAQATAKIWEHTAAGFVEQPERYVLFHEIMEAAGKWVESSKNPPTQNDALAELLRARPELARVKPAPEQALSPDPGSSAPQYHSKVPNPPESPRRPSPSAPSSSSAHPPPPHAPAGRPQSRSKQLKLTQEDLDKMRKYYKQDLSAVSYEYFVQDFGILALDLTIRRVLEPDVFRFGESQAHRLTAFQQHPHSRAARVRDVTMLYTHLAYLLPCHPFPITPLKLALFAFAYSPQSSHVERFDQAEGTAAFVAKRMYPRLLKEEITHALDDLELIQVVSRGDGGERVTEFEMDQWGEWRMGIMKELWGDLPGLNAPRPPLPSKAPSRRRPPAFTGPPAAVPFAPPPLPVLSPLKRRKTLHASPHDRAEDLAAAPPSPHRRGYSPTPSSTSSSYTSSARRRPRRRGGWYYVREPSPHPLFIPAVKGSLSSFRRPPEVPPILPSSQVWVFGEMDEGERRRSVASHRPRRVLPEMRELEWSESSEGEDESE